MMGRKNKQLCMVMIDMEELISKDHLLRKIKSKIDFDFIYEEAREYYSAMGKAGVTVTFFSDAFSKKSSQVLSGGKVVLLRNFNGEYIP